jgi:phenylalanyl-tRNA synthetase alpha chain
MEINIDTTEEQKIISLLESRTDAEAVRMKRYLAMPDLSRTDGSPIKELVVRITGIPDFKIFDTIHVPEIMSTKIAFDLFDFPANHPARSKSDTYFPDDNHILRTQTTVMWYYYFQQEEIKARLAKREPLGVFAYGKVYRKDEIDRHHMNVFHQIDAVYIAPKETEPMDLETLKDVELKIVKAIFGDVEHRFVEETFPYTHPSTEIEIKKEGTSGSDEKDWLEILGSGVVKPSVLEKLGVDSNVYNGWAWGSGIERWAMISMELPDIRLLWSDDERVKKQLVLGQKFKEVSKYPAIVRDISFIVEKANFAPNNYFDVVRDVVGDLAEEMALIDEYENAAKFGEGKKSYAYRITYRSLDRTLTDEEVNTMHKKLEEETKRVFGGEVR